MKGEDREQHEFKVWPSYHNAIRILTGEQRLEIYDAIFAYGVDGTEPEIEDVICKAVFEVIRPNIDASVKAIISGKKGGEGRAKVPFEPPSQTAFPSPLCEPPSQGKEKESIRENGIGRENRSKGEMQSADFEQLWAVYPRKEGKAEARAAFDQVTAPTSVLIEAVEQQKRSNQWLDQNGKYIPKLAKWLREERWEDRLGSNPSGGYLRHGETLSPAMQEAVNRMLERQEVE